MAKITKDHFALQRGTMSLLRDTQFPSLALTSPGRLSIHVFFVGSGTFLPPFTNKYCPSHRS